MSTGFTPITAAKIQDASGRLLKSGRVCWFPVTSSHQRVSFTPDGGGPAISRAVVMLVVNGVITTLDDGTSPAQVADTKLTTPANIGYRVTILDETGAEVQGPGYECVQPSGSTWSLDAYVPVQPAMTILPVGFGAAVPSITFIDSVTGDPVTLSVGSGTPIWS